MKIKSLPNGVRLTTKFGNTFSIVWSSSSYSDNYDVWLETKDLNKILEAETVEVAVLDINGKYVTNMYFEGSDEVKGYVPIERVLKRALAEESLVGLLD